jgi:hypothetical protein
MKEAAVQTQTRSVPQRSGSLQTRLAAPLEQSHASLSPVRRSEIQPAKSGNHDFSQTSVWSKVKVRNNEVPDPQDPIHAPLLESYRGSVSRVPGMPQLSDAALKYSGALGRAGSARWIASTINRRNFAELWFNRQPLIGAPAGLTTPVINGQTIASDQDVRTAIPLPAVASRVDSGRTRCWFSSGLNVTGNSIMDILTMPPWTFVAPQPDVGARIDRESWTRPPKTTQCQSGAGTATLRLVGEKGDAVLEEYIRLGEAEHDAGYQRSFDRNIGQLAGNVNALIGGMPELELAGADLPTCTGNLMGLVNYDALTTQFVLDLNAENTRIHTGNRHFTSASKAKVDGSCSTATVTISHGTL